MLYSTISNFKTLSMSKTELYLQFMEIEHIQNNPVLFIHYSRIFENKNDKARQENILKLYSSYVFERIGGKIIGRRERIELRDISYMYSINNKPHSPEYEYKQNQ